MMSRLITAIVLAAAILVSPTLAQKFALKAGKVLTMDDKDTVHDNVWVLVADGKIERILPQRGHDAPDGYTVVDHSEHWLLPGLIDPHNHTATDQRNDLHDYVYLTNPGLRAGDLIQVDTPANRRALGGGVTAALLIPGSGTNMSGFGGLARLGAETPEEAMMKSPASIKIAQAGNPERWYFGPGRTYMNYNLRQTLRKAKEYHERWNAFEAGKGKRPEYNETWHGFRAMFAKDFPASVHTQMFQVASKTMTMLVDEFGIDVMIDHGTFDAYKAASLAVERDCFAMVGPRVWWMDEQDGTVNSCAGEWWRGGVRKVGLNTDAGVLPQEDLRMQGSMSTRFGWKTYPALKGMTRVAADSLKVGHRIGQIAAGMEADIVAWTGNPIDFRSGVERVYVMGRLAYDASAEPRRY